MVSAMVTRCTRSIMSWELNGVREPNVGPARRLTGILWVPGTTIRAEAESLTQAGSEMIARDIGNRVGLIVVHLESNLYLV